MQSKDESLPVTDVELFGQSTHGSAPVKSLYDPALHARHGPPSGPSKPGIHPQLDLDALPPDEEELGGHLVHSMLPMMSLYVPCGHGTQDGPMKAALIPISSPSVTSVVVFTLERRPVWSPVALVVKF